LRYTHDLAAAWPATDPSVYGGAQKAIFTAEGQPFHLIADGVPAFEGLTPRQ
jgi:hypothetical protein